MIAVAIRNAGARYRDVRAEESVRENVDSEQFRIATTDFIDSFVVSGLYKLNGTVPESVPAHQKVPEYLRSRLVVSNMKRRNRIDYASRHSTKLRERRTTFPSKANDTSGASKKLLLPKVSPNDTTEPPQVTELGRAMTIAPSQASTAPTPFNREDFELPSSINQGIELDVIVTPAGSFVAGKLTMEYPRPPKVSQGSSYFECSCCHLILSREHTKEDLWKYVLDPSIRMVMRYTEIR